jgi:hypothetical protein
MQIILHRHVAEEVAKRHTVLELESFEIDGQLVEAFCVVTADKVRLGDLMTLERDKQLHQRFVEANKKQDYHQCRVLSTDLYGKFGGELDSFYDEILSRTK